MFFGNLEKIEILLLILDHSVEMSAMQFTSISVRAHVKEINVCALIFFSVPYEPFCVLSIRIPCLVEFSLVYGNGRGHCFVDVRLMFMRMVMFGAVLLRGGCVTAAVGACSSDDVIFLAMTSSLEIEERACDVPSLL